MGVSPFFFIEKKMLNNRVDTIELIRIIDAVANEKSIDKELVCNHIYGRSYRKSRKN